MKIDLIDHLPKGTIFFLMLLWMRLLKSKFYCFVKQSGVLYSAQSECEIITSKQHVFWLLISLKMNMWIFDLGNKEDGSKFKGNWKKINVCHYIWKVNSKKRKRNSRWSKSSWYSKKSRNRYWWGKGGKRWFQSLLSIIH